MHSIPYPNISAEPVIGCIIVVFILLCLFLVSGIKINEFFTPDGFAKIYDEQPWIVYLSIAIILYASLSMWNVSTKNKYKNKNTENFNADNTNKTDNANNTDNKTPNATVKILKDTDSNTGSSMSSNTDSSMSFSEESGANSSEESKVSSEKILEDKKQVNPILLSFDNFYTTYISKNTGKINPDEKIYLTLRTKIEGKYYYLIIKSDDEQNIQSYKSPISFRKEVLCRSCKVGSKYVRPVLIREDALTPMYNTFLSDVKRQYKTITRKNSDSMSFSMPSINLKSVSDGSETFDGTIGGIINLKDDVDHDNRFEYFTSEQKYYPRFVHHLDMMIQPEAGSLFGPNPTPRVNPRPNTNTNSNSNPNTNSNTNSNPNIPAYVLMGLNSEDVSDLSTQISTLQSILTATQAFSKILATETIDDRLFVCASQPSNSFTLSDKGNSLYAETYAPLIGSDTNGINKEDDSKIITSVPHEKLGSIVNFYYYDSGKKYYLSRLNGFKSRVKNSNKGTSNDDDSKTPKIFPIGIMPQDYVAPKIHDSSMPDYSLCQKIDFEVILMRLQQLK